MNEFILSPEYKQFAEFCNTCLERKLIGICYGLPGVGKTKSSLHYTQWHKIEPVISKPSGARIIPASVVNCHSLFFTPEPSYTNKRLIRELKLQRNKFEKLVQDAVFAHHFDDWSNKPMREYIKLLIIDEADQLNLAGFEQLRHFFNKSSFGMVLIGSKGFDKRLFRYPQLQSKIGLVYEFKNLNEDSARNFIREQFLDMGWTISDNDPVTTAIYRLSNGNFRNMERIFKEIKRLAKLNKLVSITPDVVEVAKNSILLGV